MKKEIQNNYFSLKEITYFFILIYILWWGMEIVLNNFIDGFQPNYISLGILLFMCIVSQVGINIVPGIFLYRFKGISVNGIFKVNRVSIKQLLLSFSLFLSFNGIVLFLDNVMNFMLGTFGIQYQMNNYSIAKDLPTLIVFVLTGGILTPVCEELFYRGFIISSLEKRGAKLAIIYSAVCFAVMHSNPYRLSTLFLYSIFMGIIVYYTNSTLPGIIFHIINNIIYHISSYFLQGDLVTKSIIKMDKRGEIQRLGIQSLIFIACLVISFWAIKKLKKLWEEGKRITKKNVVEPSEPSSNKKLAISIAVLMMLFIIKIILY